MPDGGSNTKTRDKLARRWRRLFGLPPRPEGEARHLPGSGFLSSSSTPPVDVRVVLAAPPRAATLLPLTPAAVAVRQRAEGVGPAAAASMTATTTGDEDDSTGSTNAAVGATALWSDIDLESHGDVRVAVAVKKATTLGDKGLISKALPPPPPPSSPPPLAERWRAGVGAARTRLAACGEGAKAAAARLKPHGRLWCRHSMKCVCGVLLGVAMLGLLLGLAIGLGAGTKIVPRRAHRQFKPTGDAQLDALLLLQDAVDASLVLDDEWNADAGRRGRYCGWRQITCTPDGRWVTGVNFTTTGFEYVLTGELPPGEVLASGLPRLEVFDARMHQLSGTLPPDWARLGGSLRVLRLDANQLEGGVPESWGDNLTRLEVLTLWSNRLSGRLPRSLGQLPHLQVLDLSFQGGGGFTGPLPDAWAALRALRELRLDVNSLSGPLPASWSALGGGRLEVLTLSENRLAGTLPASWGGLTNLKELWLEYNNLSGAPPDAWKGMAALEKLALNNNQLDGRVPGSLGGGMRSLLAAYTYGNAGLSGCLPAAWGARMMTMADFSPDVFMAQGTGLSGFCGGGGDGSGFGGGGIPPPTVHAPVAAALS